MVRVRDCPAAVRTDPQRKSGWLSCWTLEDPAGSRTTSRLDLACLHDGLRIAKAPGRETTITRLLRVSFEAVGRIVVMTVNEHLDDRRLNDLYRIGVDEVSYRKGHCYLTVVADHDRSGAVIWVGEGKGAKTVAALYDELGQERMQLVRKVAKNRVISTVDFEARHGHKVRLRLVSAA